jgi:pyruvate kinase
VSPAEAIASSAVKTARDVKAAAIIVLTETGNSAQLIAKYRPSMPIFAVTSVPAVARQLQGYVKNTRSDLVSSMHGTDSIISEAIAKVVKEGLAKEGDPIVVVYGSVEAHAGSTNLLRVYTA